MMTVSQKIKHSYLLYLSRNLRISRRKKKVEAFSLLVKSITIRIALTLAISYGWKLFQLDVNHAFLNGFLDVNQS